MLITTLPSEPIVSVQTPIRLNNYSEPQPDFLILKPRFDFYATKHPTPTDVFALIEVSDSTIQADRTVKAPLYSREGIQELWILNRKNPSLEVYRSPASDGYQNIQVLNRTQQVSFQAFPDLYFAVEQLLGQMPSSVT
ncbi:MAG: Uma2 family endonuclease [Cyanobacteria bacterium P01_H01_bin.15]